ncbi:MAG: alpha/beta hydrolase [Hyphomonadaceae bacterium]
MHRRYVLGAIASAAAAVLGACANTSAPPPSAGFQSDRISVAAAGEGRDVIFIPGLSSHPEIWDSTVESLGPGYRVHLVHVRGFGGLEPGANADGPVAAPVAEEIARYIEANGLDHPAVIGHSMGGTIGMMLAARHPDSVGKLMVVDMFPFMGAMFGGPAATPETLTPIADNIRAQMAAVPQGVVTPILRQTIESMVGTEAARAQIIEHARQSNNVTTANAFRELIVTDLRPELANITMPFTTLYVIPPQAPITPEQYAAFMVASYANIPQANVVRIDDSRHFIMIDAHARFMQEVRAFLAE